MYKNLRAEKSMRETSLVDLFGHLSLTLGAPLSEDERVPLESLSAQERQSLRDVSIRDVEDIEVSVRRITQSNDEFFSPVDFVVIRLDFVVVQLCILYFMVFFVGEADYYRQQSVYNVIYSFGLLFCCHYYHSNFVDVCGDWKLFYNHVSGNEPRDFSQSLSLRFFPLKYCWTASKGYWAALSPILRKAWSGALLPFGKESTVSQKWIFADFLLKVLHCCSDGVSKEEMNKTIKTIQEQREILNKGIKRQEGQVFFGKYRWVYTNCNQVFQLLSQAVMLLSRAGMNAISRRQLNAFLDDVIQFTSDEATVDSDFKVTILRQLFQLFSDGQCQQIIPVMYKEAMGKRHFDEAYLIQIVSEMAKQCVDNDELLLYLAQMIDTSFDAFVHQPSRSSETTVKKLIRFILYSEVSKKRTDLRQRRIDQFNAAQIPEENLLILLIRDFAKNIYFHSSYKLHHDDSLSFIGALFAALSKVDFVVTSERQQVVSSVFRGLSSYFSKPSQSCGHGASFACVCEYLSRLSDEDCHIESSLFWFEFLSFVNGVFRQSGVIDNACSPTFVKFFVSKVVEYGGEETISQILGNSGVSVDGLMENKMWRSRTPSNKIEMLYSLFYSLSLLLRYNYIDMFRESFQSSEDFSLFFKQKFSTDISVEKEKKSLYQSFLSGLDLSTRFVDSSLCFLDKVENEERQQVCKDSSIEDYGERKRSSILFLAFLFDYSGRNRVFASDWIARLMYGNVLGNPGFVKWCLMGLNSTLLFLSLTIGFFDFSRRRTWYKNILNLTYSVYFLLTRSIVQFPRLIWLSIQVVLLVLGNLLYRAGRLRVLVFSSCLLGALACVNTLTISGYFVPVLACVFYYAFKLVSQVILPCLGVDANVSLFSPLVTNNSASSDSFSSYSYSRVNSEDSDVLSQQPPREDDLDSSGVIVSPSSSM